MKPHLLVGFGSDDMEMKQHRKPMNVVKKIPAGLLTAVVTAAILWLTLAPHPLPETDMSLITGIDKVLHGCMFGGLFVAVWLDVAVWCAVRKRDVLSLWRGLPVLSIALAVVAFGGAIELVQGAMGLGRGCDVLDFVADAVGVGIAVWLTPTVLRWL